MQAGQGQPLAQILRCLGQGQQGFQRSLIAPVAASLAVLVVNLEVGLGAGTMVIEIGVEVSGVVVS